MPYIGCYLEKKDYSLATLYLNGSFGLVKYWISANEAAGKSQHESMSKSSNLKLFRTRIYIRWSILQSKIRKIHRFRRTQRTLDVLDRIKMLKLPRVRHWRQAGENKWEVWTSNKLGYS